MRSADVTIAQIVADLGGELVGSPQSRISAIASLERATSSDVSFLSSAKYANQFAQSLAGCVIAKSVDWQIARHHGFQGAAILTDDPYLYYARLTQWWKRQQAATSAQVIESCIHPTAVIAPSAQIAQGVVIGALCVVEDGAVIGEGTSIGKRQAVHRTDQGAGR